MNSRFLPLACAAAIALPLFSTEAQAGVADKTYDVVAVSTAFDYFEDALAFDDEGGASTTDFSGGYNEIFSFAAFSLFTLDLVDSQDESYGFNLIGLQIGPVIVSRGDDSDGAQYFLFGTEQEEEPLP